MFGMSGTELTIILILALLLLGPAKLPDLARSLGKGIREFRRATDDLRSSVEGEFYRMDQPKPPTKLEGAPVPVTGALPAPGAGPAVPPGTAAAPAAAAPTSPAVATAAPAAAPQPAAPATPTAPPSEGGTT